ncbi:MAG: DMT family transporter, partial [Rubrivivax sp.]
WTAMLAVGFLGERLNRWKVLAIALGLIGVGVIVRPAAAGLNAGQAIALAAAVGFAASVTLTKSLTRSDSAVAIIFWMLVFQSLLGIVPAIAVWRWPSAAAWGWVMVVAFCGTFSHYCMARAMMHADATMVVPMDFLRVPLSALAGWLVYREAIDLYTVAGAVLILAGNLLNLKRRPDAPTSAAPRSR